MIWSPLGYTVSTPRLYLVHDLYVITMFATDLTWSLVVFVNGWLLCEISVIDL